MEKTENFECPDCGAVFENADECKELVCECGAVLISEEQELAEQLLAETISRKWYYSRDEKQFGPIPWNRIKKFIGEQKLEANDLIWSRGMENWEKIRSFPELVNCFPEGQRPEPLEPVAMPSNRTGEARFNTQKTGKKNNIVRPRTFIISVSAGLLAAIGIFQLLGIAAVIYAVHQYSLPLHHATWLVAAFIAGAVFFMGIAQLIRLLCYSSQRICEISEKFTTSAGYDGDNEKNL